MSRQLLENTENESLVNETASMIDHLAVIYHQEQQPTALSGQESSPYTVMMQHYKRFQLAVLCSPQGNSTLGLQAENYRTKKLLSIMTLIAV